MNWKTDVKNRFSLSGQAGKWNSMYDMAKSLYEYNFQLRRDYVADYIFRHFCKSSKIFDLGCGAGPLLDKLMGSGYKPIGMDYSKDMLLLAKKRIEKKNSKKHVLLQGDCEKLPFVDNSIDCIACLGVISYVKDINLAIKEIHRVLKPNAIVILSFRNNLRPLLFDPIQLLMAVLRGTVRILKGVLKKKSSVNNSEESIDIGRFFYPHYVAKQVESNGFLFREFKGIGFGPLQVNHRELFSIESSIKISMLLDKLFSYFKVNFAYRWGADVSIFVYEKRGLH